MTQPQVTTPKSKVILNHHNLGCQDATQLAIRAALVVQLNTRQHCRSGRGMIGRHQRVQRRGIRTLYTAWKSLGTLICGCARTGSSVTPSVVPQYQHYLRLSACEGSNFNKETYGRRKDGSNYAAVERVLACRSGNPYRYVRMRDEDCPGKSTVNCRNDKFR